MDIELETATNRLNILKKYGQASVDAHADLLTKASEIDTEQFHRHFDLMTAMIPALAKALVAQRLINQIEDRQDISLADPWSDVHIYSFIKDVVVGQVENHRINHTSNGSVNFVLDAYLFEEYCSLFAAFNSDLGWSRLFYSYELDM